MEKIPMGDGFPNESVKNRFFNKDTENCRLLVKERLFQTLNDEQKQWFESYESFSDQQIKYVFADAFFAGYSVGKQEKDMGSKIEKPIDHKIES